MKTFNIILCICVASVSSGKINFDNQNFEGAHPVDGWRGQDSKFNSNLLS